MKRLISVLCFVAVFLGALSNVAVAQEDQDITTHYQGLILEAMKKHGGNFAGADPNQWCGNILYPLLQGVQLNGASSSRTCYNGTFPRSAVSQIVAGLQWSIVYSGEKMDVIRTGRGTQTGMYGLYLIYYNASGNASELVFFVDTTAY